MFGTKNTSAECSGKPTAGGWGPRPPPASLVSDSWECGFLHAQLSQEAVIPPEPSSGEQVGVSRLALSVLNGLVSVERSLPRARFPCWPPLSRHSPQRLPHARRSCAALCSRRCLAEGPRLALALDLGELTSVSNQDSRGDSFFSVLPARSLYTALWKERHTPLSCKNGFHFLLFNLGFERQNPRFKTGSCS